MSRTLSTKYLHFRKTYNKHLWSASDPITGDVYAIKYVPKMTGDLLNKQGWIVTIEGRYTPHLSFFPTLQQAFDYADSLVPRDRLLWKERNNYLWEGNTIFNMEQHYRSSGWVIAKELPKTGHSNKGKEWNARNPRSERTRGWVLRQGSLVGRRVFAYTHLAAAIYTAEVLNHVTDVPREFYRFPLDKERAHAILAHAHPYKAESYISTTTPRPRLRLVHSAPLDPANNASPDA